LNTPAPVARRMALSNTSMLVRGAAANRGSEKAFDFGMFNQFRSCIVWIVSSITPDRREVEI
jgi:hypothetical protein